MAPVSFPRRLEVKPGPYRSRERVYGEDAEGRRVLLYAVGAPIPEDEARRQGLLEHDAAKPAAHAEEPSALEPVAEPELEELEVEDTPAEPELEEKAGEPAENKAAAPAENKRATGGRRRRPTEKE